MDRPGLVFTLSQLDYFVTAVETGSFTAAAEALGVSQPAVAEQIQRLERIAGTSLFARQARGVTPTRAGRDLEPHARQVLDASRAAMTAISSGKTIGEGSVAFGTFGSAHHYEITGLITTFLDDNPGSRIRIEGRNSSSTADAVRSGSLDAAIVALPIDETGLDIDPIFEGEVFYVSVDLERVRRPVTIEQIVERPFILYESSSGIEDPTRRQLAARAQAAGMQIRPRIEVESADVALELAARGLADTYAPKIVLSSLDPRLHPVGFDPPLTDTFALIRRTGSRLGRPLTDLVERFTAHILNQIAAAGESEIALETDL